MKKLWTSKLSEWFKVMNRWLLLLLICLLPFESGNVNCLVFRFEPNATEIDPRQTGIVTLMDYNDISKVTFTLDCEPADLATKKENGDNIEIIPNPKLKDNPKKPVNGKCTLKAIEALEEEKTQEAKAVIKIVKEPLQALIHWNYAWTSIPRPFVLISGNTVEIRIKGGQKRYYIYPDKHAIVSAKMNSDSSDEEYATVTGASPGLGTIDITDNLQPQDVASYTFKIIAKPPSP